MNKREWAGLVVHCLSLIHMTGQDMMVGKEYAGGDGMLARKVTEKGKTSYHGVLVEQTLVTHKAHTDLLTGVKERLEAKSSRGKNYAENKHLIIWCNIDGSFEPGSLAKVISIGAFNIVSIIGFDGNTRDYRCLIFDKKIKNRSIYSGRISEKWLLMEAAKIP